MPVKNKNQMAKRKKVNNCTDIHNTHPFVDQFGCCFQESAKRLNVKK